MRRFLPVVFLLALASITSAQVNVNVILRSPMPSEIATWERDRSVLQVIITNTGQNTYSNASVSFTVTDVESGRRVISSRDGNPAIPRFTIPSLGTVTRYGPDMVARDAITVDPSYESLATTTGRIPEGNYQFCVRILQQDGTEITATGSTCGSFTIIIPDPPTLISPEDDALLSTTLPVFQWTPVMISGGVQARYRLKIAPIYTGQSARDAIDRNAPLYDQTLLTSSLTYPPSARQFATEPTATGFAWQVQAVDASGSPVARNDGKSEIRSFRTSAASTMTLDGVYPANHDTIPWIPSHLVVRFSPYGDDITRMEYTLTLTGPGGVHYENSRPLSWPSGPRISQGVPTNERAQLIIVDITGSDAWASWASTLERGVEYSWTVSASFVKAGATVTATSAPRTFVLGATIAQHPSPANGDTLTTGTVPELRWQPQSPGTLNPPDLLGISGSAPGMHFGAAVETWKLEVSRQPDFSTTITSHQATIPATGNYVTGQPEASNLYAQQSYRLGSAPDTGRYFWRVSWLKSDGTPYVTGPTWNFVIADSVRHDTTHTVARRDTSGPCVDDCSAPAPTNTTASTRTFREGDTVRVGRFIMTLTHVSGTGSSLSGEGTIPVPFLRAPIMVEFSGIRVNTDNQMFDGQVTGKQATGSPLSPSLANQLGSTLGLTNDQVSSIQSFASDAGRLVSALSGATPVGLPIGFDNMVDGERTVLAIIGLVFSPTDARLNAAMSFPLPFLGPGVGLGLGARNICFHPAGLGGDGQGQLYLAADLGYREPGTWGFVFKSPTPSDSGTYVAWDCRGFQELRLAADVEFPRDWFIPQPDDGSSLVKAHFKTTIRRGGDWIAAMSMDNCQLAGAPGFAMEIQEMAIDQSDVRNPDGIIFPAGFTGPTDGTWRGFFIRRAAITLPPECQTFEGSPPRIAVTNLLGGRGGFTASIRGENVIQYPMGNFGEWGASIDTIGIDFVSSSLTRGFMNGRIKIPVTDSALVYQAVVARSTSGSGVDFTFSIHPGDTINADLWSARLSLNPTSRIELGTVGGNFQASATLSGSLTISGDAGGIPALSFRGVRFENFRVMTSSPYIDAGTWSFASEQHSMAGFPVSINNIGLVAGDRGGRPGVGVQFTLAVNLQPGSSTISGATTLSIWGRLASGSGAQNFEFAGVDLDSIGLAADLGAVEIDGGVRFYRGDATFGDGFRGAIHAVFVHQVTVAATIQFGEVHSYRYWYVDAKALFNPGIPIFTGVGIYGFGGGAWYHMHREGSDPSLSSAGSGTSGGDSHPGATNSGYRFVPDDGTEFGFRAMVVIGTYPSSEGFNADVAFEAEFLSGGGIGRISILGDGYMMAAVNNRDQAKVTAHVDLTYNFPAQTFHGVFNVNINADPFTGGGQMVMHFEPTTWYIKVGTPHDRVNLNLANWLRIDAYLMMGQNLDAPMELPPEVTSILGPLPVVRNPGIEHGDGFAFGASANFSTGRLQFLIFYARIDAGLGFDISLLNLGPAARCEGSSGPMGINGWYAMGQLYTYIDASVGIYVDLWFTSGEFEILRVGVAAALQAGAPNPTWLAGAIAGEYSILGGVVSGHCRFEFKLGEECLPVTESPLARLDLVSDIKPTDGSRDVDVLVEPQAAFNFTINQPFELRDFASDGSERVRSFRVKIRNFTLNQTGSGQSVPGGWNLSSEGTQATYSPHDALSAHTQYTASVAAYGEEFSDGTWRNAQRMDGSSIEQSVSTTFTTGNAPTNIPDRNVAYSYPLNRQRFFLQGECPGGLVVLKTGQPDLFAPKTGYTVSFLARFIPTFGGSDVEVQAIYNSSSREVSFSIPTLSTNAVYALQIVRKEVPQERRTGLALSSALTSTTLPGRVSAAVSLRTMYTRTGISLQTQQRTLPGTQVKVGETLLYLYYFKTSQFTNLRDKINSLTAQPTTITPPFLNLQIMTAHFSGPEFFDSYDMEGLDFTRDGRDLRIRPLIGLDASARNDNWHTRFTNPWVYDNIARFRRMGQWAGTVEWERYQRSSYLKFADWTSSPSPLLGDWEIAPQPRSATARWAMTTVTMGTTASRTAATTGGMSGMSRTASFMPAPPTINIEHRHGIIVPLDFGRVQSRAAWYLAHFGGEFISADDARWLRGILAKSYELYSHGNYSLGFYYTFCEEPDTPAMRHMKLFRY